MTGTSTLIERVLHPMDNIDRVAMYYVQEIGLKATRESLRKTIEEHPDYPSLLAISDALGFKEYYLWSGTQFECFQNIWRRLLVKKDTLHGGKYSTAEV